MRRCEFSEFPGSKKQRKIGVEAGYDRRGRKRRRKKEIKKEERKRRN
jgi:hypothetical protein